MDLNDQERYAAAALFTLALHHSQGRVNGGIPGSKHNLGAWGKPADEEFLHSLDSASEHATLNHAELNRFWGYDCYAAGGLCDILYGHLHIPETSKPGLKLLADVMDPSSQADIIKQYRDLLDASLASEPGPEVEPLPNYKEVNEEGIWEPPLDAPPLEGEQPASPDRPGSGARKAGHGTGGGHASRSKPAREDQDEEPLLGGGGDAEESEEQAAAAEAAARPIAQQHEDTLNQQGLEREFEDKATVSGNDHASASQLAGAAAQAGPSAVAMGALMEILDATMLRHAMPNLQDVLEQRAAGAKEGASPATSSGKQPSPKEAAEQAIDQPELAVLRLPQVRWYDARARVALRMMAEWMRVPWAKMIIFESLLAEQAQLPEARQEGPEAEKSWKSKRIKYAKIGAAASGAAALMVITGGLAAPLLAGFAGAAFAGVGLGSVGALVGGSAGTAAMIAGITGGGGYLAGSKMAHRVGDVQQFGFRQVPDDGVYTSGMGKAVDEAVPDQSLDAMAAKADANDAPLEQQAQAGSTEIPSDAASGTPSSTETLASGSSPPAAAEEPKEGLAKQKSWFSWGSGKKKQPAEDEENPLLPVPGALAKQANPHMSLIIGVNGWVAKPEDFVDMWRHLGCAEHERFTLVWETEELIRLNTSLVDFVKSQAAQAAAKWFAASVSAALMAAVALPLTILSATNFIDGAWGIALDRAGKAGILLAHVLMSGAHGDRPVTLIGYSMGARLVFSCLMELSRCQAKGIVEHAILLGTPENVVPERFAAARRVVAGRLVNGYSKQDWILGVLFRSGSGFTRAAAGLTPVGVPNIENVDLSDLVTGHFDYIKKMDTIIDQLGFA